MAKIQSTNDDKKPEISERERSQQPRREKEVSITQQSSDEPAVEKEITRQRRAEVQNPLMHESY